MKEVILLRCGEIILKGLNRPMFEAKLMKNIKKALYGLGKIKVVKSQSRMYIEPEEENYDIEEAIKRVTRVFGVVSVSHAVKIATDWDVIKEYALKLVRDAINEGHNTSFKVESKRGDKSFKKSSPEISRDLGGEILSNFPELKVDVNNPDFIVYVEVRDSTYVYSKKVEGLCGMPVGTNGKGMLLLSGGIDSPVAGFMMAKRGIDIEAIHFDSYPYTSERAKNKVIDLAKILAQYTGSVRLHIVPFTDIQLHIYENAPHDELTIIMRRVMMKISEEVATNRGAQALVTGEALGQVASQTMESINVTNTVVNMPVFRPLIGMDKNEVIKIARKIDTYETSILPYEDCCTIFAPSHPVTKPNIDRIEKSESILALDDLMKIAIKNIEVIEC